MTQQGTYDVLRSLPGQAGTVAPLSPLSGTLPPSQFLTFPGHKSTPPSLLLPSSTSARKLEVLSFWSSSRVVPRLVFSLLPSLCTTLVQLWFNLFRTRPHLRLAISESILCVCFLPSSRCNLFLFRKQLSPKTPPHQRHHSSDREFLSCPLFEPEHPLLP